MIKRAAWLRDQILEFHLPFPRTYNWPWNCDSILLWYCPNRSAKEKKIEPKYPHSPKYTHNTLCKRQMPFLTFSHPEQWFRFATKISKFFDIFHHCWWWKFRWPMMKIFIVFEIWPIKLESLISFRWQNIGSVQQEKQKRRKSKQEIKSTKSNFKCILIWNPYLSFNLCFYNR